MFSDIFPNDSEANSITRVENAKSLAKRLACGWFPTTCGPDLSDVIAGFFINRPLYTDHLKCSTIGQHGLNRDVPGSFTSSTRGLMNHGSHAPLHSSGKRPSGVDYANRLLEVHLPVSTVSIEICRGHLLLQLGALKFTGCMLLSIHPGGDSLVCLKCQDHPPFDRLLEVHLPVSTVSIEICRGHLLLQLGA